MKSTAQNAEQIQNAVAALPFNAELLKLSVSLNAGGAVVTVQRERGDFVTYEWAAVNPGQLFWGHYDMTETEAAADHAQRFARLTGGAL
jgi:hypothetical protein